MIHCLITRRVRPGKVQEFETALRRFIQRSLDADSTCGAMMIVPSQAGPSEEYGILRSFPNETAKQTFYDSSLFASWEAEVAPLVVGPPTSRELHGLEAFFQNGGTQATALPPKWKMACLTWLGVWPSVYFWSLALHPFIADLPQWFRTGIVTGLVVPTLAWGVMPQFTKIFHKWLYAK